MNKTPRTRRPVKYRSAAEWPAWTDDDFWVPTDSDKAEHASWNVAGHDEDSPPPDDPIWDVWAEEAEAARLHEAGFRLF